MSIGTSFPNGGMPGQWADDSYVQGTPDHSADRVIGYFIG
jgi:hypothetical protein